MHNILYNIAPYAYGAWATLNFLHLLILIITYSDHLFDVMTNIIIITN